MAISDKDHRFMQEVSEYYRSTKDSSAPEGSVRSTAVHFGLTRTKVQKILITTGDYSSAQTRTVKALRDSGMSVKQIARSLGLSEATVSSSLPYDTVFHGTAEPSDHTQKVRSYRAYEKEQKSRQVGRLMVRMKENIMEGEKNMKGEWMLDGRVAGNPAKEAELVKKAQPLKETQQKTEQVKESGPVKPGTRKELAASRNQDAGCYPGALADRSAASLGQEYHVFFQPEPAKVMRLHLELDAAGINDEQRSILRRYAMMKGSTISRDVIVPSDIPLYALHYVIQRAFGWQNAHLHRFYISEDNMGHLTENMVQWKAQVGVIYRSPLMNMDDMFWNDDYKGGSFRNWLRSKYTGPYVSRCYREGLIPCRKDMDQLDLDQDYYLQHYKSKWGGEFTHLYRKVRYENGERTDVPVPSRPGEWFEVVKLRDLPLTVAETMFERNSFDLLERLPVCQVLALHDRGLDDGFKDGEHVRTWNEMLDHGVGRDVSWILGNGLHSFRLQPAVCPFTDELLYSYDFGDDWVIRITGSWNCSDLVEKGTVTREKVDKCNIKVRNTYRPVLLCRDGDMLLDDVGGVDGYVRFLDKLNTMGPDEEDENGMTLAEVRQWASGQGWHRSGSTDINLL